MNSENTKHSTIDCSNVLQSGAKSSHNSKLSMPYSKDIAPVHSPSSKNMACQKEIKSPSKKLQWAEDSVDCELTSQFNNKLIIKKCALNGTNIITTDAEIHCGPLDTANFIKGKFASERMVCNEIKHQAVNKLEMSESAIVSSGLKNGPSSQNHSLSNNISGLDKSQNETNSILKCTEKMAHVTDVLCNGYSVCEATSSNSIAISDVSAGSDKSINSSSIDSNQWTSKSQLPYDINTSCRSDSQKILDRFIPIAPPTAPPCNHVSEIIYVNYVNENQMSSIMKLIQRDLSEPYSIYTYRYFIHNWPKLCFLAIHNSEVVGAIVCKLDMHKKTTVRGYIAMLAVDEKYRKKKIGSNLVLRAIRAMTTDDADEVVLETEITNQPALKLYENLGFVRDKRLFRYYLNGVDALRLKLWLR